ncbi:uncharacterized protein [Chironomus tepperi]|uniref:uncharacterized protein n=1 Tax=Chironomus tepperi TaxID=113505 RepID=UPI00391F85AF
MMLKLFVLILSLNLVFSFKTIDYELTIDNKNLVESFKTVRNEIKKNFATKGFTLMTIADPSNKETHEAVKLSILKYAFETETVRMPNLMSPTHNPYRYSVLIVDNFKSFDTSRSFINSATFKYSGFQIVILLDGNLEDVHNIFTYFWSKDISNVIALINQNGTLLLNFEPFRNPQRCDDTSPKVINNFIDGKFTSKITFKKRFHNLNLCPITVTTFKDSVAAFKENLPNGSIVIKGYEIDMIRTIAEMLNFTLHLKFREGTYQWGMIHENGTITAGMADLKDKKTDILVGDMYLKLPRLKYFDSSMSYNNYPLFFILSSEMKLNWFEKLLKPFQPIIWIILLMAFCVGIAVIWIINVKFKHLKEFVYGKGVNHPASNMISVCIGLPQLVLPQRNFARFILMMFIILCLIIRSIYLGSLYKTLQSDLRHKEPQVIDELIDKDYLFVISESNMDSVKIYQPKIYSKSKSLEYTNGTYVDIFKIMPKRTAIMASKLELLEHGMNYDNFPYKICNENFFIINIVLYYNKNYFLIPAIDDVIRKLLTHGFMDQWMKNYDKRDRWKFKSVRPRVMTFGHLSGAFYLILIGNISSAFVFLIEILYFKVNVHQGSLN